MSENDQLTDHFTFGALTHTSHSDLLGMNRILAQDYVQQLLLLARGLEWIREHVLLGAPILVNSGFRCKALNLRVRGVATSQHCLGQAADIVAPAFGTPYEVCRAIEASAFVYDQLIAEYTWAHVSIPGPSETARLQALTLRKTGGYATGIVEAA